MRRCDEKLPDKVIVLQILGIDAPAAALLRAVRIDCHALDIALAGEGIAAGLLFDEILNVDLIFHVLDLGQPFVAEFITDCDQFILQNALDQVDIAQNIVEIRDLLFQLFVFRRQLFPLQALQRFQAHIQDALGMHVRKTEALHELLLGIIVAAADDLNDFINMILGDEQAFQKMGPLLGFSQVIFCPANDQLFLEGQIFVQNMAQGENLRLCLVLYQGQRVLTENADCSAVCA